MFFFWRVRRHIRGIPPLACAYRAYQMRKPVFTGILSMFINPSCIAPLPLPPVLIPTTMNSKGVYRPVSMVSGRVIPENYWNACTPL